MSTPTLTLNDRREMPVLGLGVWQTPPEETARCVQDALKTGYRMIDTAAAYRNEAGVGEGLRASGVAREDVYVSTKLWNNSHGYDRAIAAFEKTLSRLGFDYVDLYFIHWPAPGLGQFVEAWKALIQLRKEGRARSIGVCNFNGDHIERLIAETGEAPSVNQIELHPAFQQKQMRAFNAKHGIVTQSWSPLGQGAALSNPAIKTIAAKHGKSPAQIIIRWHLDQGRVVIPKSVRAERIAENFDVFNFTLDAQDMDAIAALDAAKGRIGPDPDSFDGA